MKTQSIRVLVLGISGMLGNAVFKYMRQMDVDVIGTIGNEAIPPHTLQLRVGKGIHKLLPRLIEESAPTHIVNCIGAIRPERSLKSIENVFFINSYLPRILELCCVKYGIRLIQPSTDCVFDGIQDIGEGINPERDTGAYSEYDLPNEYGPYGMSKYIGETTLAGNLTIRTSIIGHEINNCRNLLDWFLKQTEPVDGYLHVLWNGITTLTWAEIALRIIQKSLYMDRQIIQVVSPQIVSKYELLSLFAKVFNKKILIEPVKEPKSNKTLIQTADLGEITDMIKPLEEQLRDLKDFYAF